MSQANWLKSGGLRVLLVEDHRDTLEMLRKMLERTGHEVHAASSMRAALDCARQWTFDALVSDIGLPDGDGWELLRELRALGPFGAIAMSGCNSREDLRRSAEAGYECHLAKPFDPDLLYLALSKMSALSEPLVPLVAETLPPPPV